MKSYSQLPLAWVSHFKQNELNTYQNLRKSKTLGTCIHKTKQFLYFRKLMILYLHFQVLYFLSES